TSARFARWRDNRQLDSIERKHARAAAGWLDPLLDGIENGEDYFERFARTGPDQGLRGFVELCRDRRFQPPRSTKNIHVRSSQQAGARRRVDDFSGGRRRASASVPGMLDHDGKGDSSGGWTKRRKADEPPVRRLAIQLRGSGLAGDAGGMVPQHAASTVHDDVAHVAGEHTRVVAAQKPIGRRTRALVLLAVGVAEYAVRRDGCRHTRHPQRRHNDITLAVPDLRKRL